VPISQAAQHDADLHCSSNPSCPQQNVCEAGAAAHCVEGRCELFAATLPLSDVCGLDGALACPGPQVCTINVDPSASLFGLGVCLPPPP
jgi:hypothetical protein